MSIRFKGGHKRGSLARWWQRAHERARLLGLGPISCIDIVSADGSSVLTLSGGEDDLVSLAASIYGNPIRYQLPALSALEQDMADARQTDLTPSYLLEALEGDPDPVAEIDEEKTKQEEAVETIAPVAAEVVTEALEKRGWSKYQIALATMVIGLAIERLVFWLF